MSDVTLDLLQNTKIRCRSGYKTRTIPIMNFFCKAGRDEEEVGNTQKKITLKI